MEKITRRQEGFYYGETKCSCADDAYRLFREDYHRSLGKNAYGRLNRLGAREERQHGYGFIFSERKECPISVVDKVPVYILGIIAGSPSLTQRKKERLPVIHLAEFILIDRIRRNKRNEAANASGNNSVTERSEILLL